MARTSIKGFFAGLAMAAAMMVVPITAHAEETSVETPVVEAEASDEVAVITFDFDLSEIATPAAEEAPVVESAPAAEVAPATDEAPAAEVAPATDEAPAAEVAPATDEAPAAEVAPATDEAPAAEVAPATDEAPAAEEEVPATTEEVAPATTEETAPAAEVPADEPEIITGELVGPANMGYAEMSDGSDAFCVEEKYEHVDDNAQYELDTEADGTEFASVFVKVAEADEAEMDTQSTRQIAQLAVWALLNPDATANYRLTVDWYWGAEGTALFDAMIDRTVDLSGWNITTWGYNPINHNERGKQYQRLISGKAEKVQETTPEEPEETPEEPEEPEETPEVPETPEEPTVPEEPETPSTPDTPVVPEQPAEPTPVVEETPAPVVVVAPAPTVAAPVTLTYTSVPQTGDVNVTMVALLALFAFVGIFGCAVVRR